MFVFSFHSAHFLDHPWLMPDFRTPSIYVCPVTINSHLFISCIWEMNIAWCSVEGPIQIDKNALGIDYKDLLLLVLHRHPLHFAFCYTLSKTHHSPCITFSLLSLSPFSTQSTSLLTQSWLRLNETYFLILSISPITYSFQNYFYLILIFRTTERYLFMLVERHHRYW